MLSRERLVSFAGAPLRLAPPSFPLNAAQSAALNAGLRPIDHLCREGEDRDADEETGASLTDQLAAAKARRAALAPAVDEAVAALDALAAVGLELSLRATGDMRFLVVSRRRTMPAGGGVGRERAV